MKRFNSLFCLPLLAFFMISLCACKGEPPVATLIEVNKKVVLAEWPDSAYIANLKEILAAEPVLKKDKEKTNIGMNVHKAPTFTLPSLVTGKKDSKTPARENAKQEPKGGPAKGAKQPQSAEAFLAKFSDALSRLQSDPSNSALYKVVEAKDGDDLFKLLKRTYGASSQNLPRFYVLSTLQSVNAGVALEHLKEGDKVRVPRI